MTKPMIPFEIEMELLTPVILPAFPMHLDGLCWWALHQHVREDQIDSALADILARDDQGVFKASAMKFVVSPTKALTSHDVTYADCWRWEKNGLIPTGRKTKIVIDGGPYRRRLQAWRSVHADRVLFTGVGHPAAIADLISHSILGIGLNYRRGAGRLGAITWRETETPFSMFDANGAPVRTLPSDSPLAVPARARPPYHRGAEEPCLVPFGIQRVIQNTTTS